jgi:hypothetical protein
MILTILIVDAVLIGLISLWVLWINITGDNEQKGAAGFAAFMLVSLILFWSAVIAGVKFVISLF